MKARSGCRLPNHLFARHVEKKAVAARAVVVVVPAAAVADRVVVVLAAAAPAGAWVVQDVVVLASEAVEHVVLDLVDHRVHR